MIRRAEPRRQGRGVRQRVQQPASPRHHAERIGRAAIARNRSGRICAARHAIDAPQSLPTSTACRCSGASSNPARSPITSSAVYCSASAGQSLAP